MTLIYLLSQHFGFPRYIFLAEKTISLWEAPCFCNLESFFPLICGDINFFLSFSEISFKSRFCSTNFYKGLNEIGMDREKVQHLANRRSIGKVSPAAISVRWFGYFSSVMYCGGGGLLLTHSNYYLPQRLPEVG
jgi:hypothetical protein